MEEIKIREDGIYLNNQKLKGVQAIKTKSTAENNHATIFLKLVAKLIWNEIGNNLWWNIFKDIQIPNLERNTMRPRRYPYSRIKRKLTMSAGSISVKNLSVGSVDERQLQRTIEKLKKQMEG